MLPLYAVPVTQTSSTSAIIYDAVVVGTSEVVEMMPESTGLSSPVSILTNVDIDTCASRGLCIEEVSTDSAAHVASSVITEFRLMPASIVTTLKNIIWDVEAGVEIGRTVSNTMSGGLSLWPTSVPTRQGGTTGSMSASEGLSALPAVSIGTSPTQNASPAVESNPGLSATACVSSPGTGAPTSVSNIYESNSSPASIYNAALNVAGSLSITSQGLGGSNRTRSRTSTTPLPTASVTCALVVTNSQGSVPNVVEVGCSSNAPSTNTSFAYVGSVMTTVTALPAGVPIQTVTTSTYITAGAVITTTSSWSTVATEVPESCIHGLVFLVFGLPEFHSSSDIPPLCHKSFSFPLGITWRLLCPPGGSSYHFNLQRPVNKVTARSCGLPGENPNGGDPDDQKPTKTQRPG